MAGKEKNGPHSLPPQLRHGLDYQAALELVRRKTALTIGTDATRPAVRNLLETLTRETLALAREEHRSETDAAGPNAPGTAPLEDGRLERALGAALLRRFERDEDSAWLVTQALIQRQLKLTRSGSSRQGQERDERLQDAAGKVLAELVGGLYPARMFREKRSSGEFASDHGFLPYLLDAVKNRCAGQSRLKRIKESFWKDKGTLDADPQDEDHRPLELRSGDAGVVRLLQREDRARERLDAIARLLKVARKYGRESTKPDVNCVLLEDFILWLKEQPTLEGGTDFQARFAEAKGISKNTVASYLKRFRDTYRPARMTTLWRHLELYTNLGGTQT